MTWLAVYPAVTVAAFMVFSRITVGEWFVSGGFFVPDETLRGQPVHVVEKIAEGLAADRRTWLLRISVLARAPSAVWRWRPRDGRRCS